VDVLFFHHPYESIKFFRKLILCAFLSGTAATIPGAILVYKTWDEEEFCSATFRFYHILRILLFLFQVPLRIYMMVKFREADRERTTHGVVNRLLELSRSRPWRFNQYAGALVYVLFALGLWLLFYYKKQCDVNAPELYHLCLATLLLFGVQFILAFRWLRSIISPPAMPGASSKVIEDNSTTKIFRAEQDDCAKLEMCRICLSDYEDEEVIRFLICKHHYHAVCIDHWLKAKKVCPLCHSPIDRPPSLSSSQSHSQS